MKWIGQHIFDLVARFRSDVHLDDIQTGTIASGGNLGLDSNNKIVKANEATGDITSVTLTADGGEGIVDSSGDVNHTIAGGNAITTAIGSGNLEINHDDTSSQASVNNSGRTFIQDITLDTYGHVTGITSATDADTHEGDITGVRITADDTNTAAVSSGSADFTIAGGTGIDTSVSSTTITIAGEDASTSNKGVARFSSDNFAVSSGAVSIKSGGVDLTDEVTGVLPVANTAAKVTSIVAGDGIDVSGATGDVTVTAETASDSNPGVVELATTGEADTGTDTARAVTPAGLKSHVDLRFNYVYMTWSASGSSTHDGSGNPEWVFPNAAKGIYEEDWTKDENISATTPGSTVFTTSRQTAVNALVIPHTGKCVGFHAHGRNDDGDRTFKAGLFHYNGGTTGETNATGIDYGSTGTGHDMTLRWVATADESESGGGSDGSAGAHSFKGPCKLVSNTDAVDVSAGDALLPAIMGNSTNTTDCLLYTSPSPRDS